MWEAQYVLVLAHHTGWTEDFIRWELPLSRGMAYFHAALLMIGHDTEWPGERDDGSGSWFDKVRDFIRRHRRKH